MSTELTIKENGYTELQNKFLDAYFGEANGDPAEAMRLAGYKHKHWAYVVAAVKDEIAKRTEGYLALNSFPAAKNIVGVMDNPVQEGGKLRLEAAKDILDRTGISKKGDGSASGGTKIGIFILPAKAELTTLPVIEHD